ncbi:HCP-like protein [Suillus paluster]|uniref:HCP-like protein n=1 Tax=Suillus paluster TaxID=48578 RepID=UPI001B8807DD|nr:HCP-like protein [Suillus paluster]KAG1726342.1 HCP-like protein [Suillus paluster]
MSAPPVPPLPADYLRQPQPPLAPPLPPLPSEYITQQRDQSKSPLPAPRPQRVDPDLPSNMARSLDQTASTYGSPQNFHLQHQTPSYRAVSPRPPYNPTPGFVPPQRTSFLPPPNNNTPWNVNPAGVPLPVSPRPPQPIPPMHHQPPTRSQSAQNAVPSLTAPIPTVQSLSTALPTVQQPAHDPALKLAWARDVLLLVDRTQNPSATDIPSGPVTITDPQLQRLVATAVPIVQQLASITHNPLPLFAAEAVYLRATLEASGAYPDRIPHNPRQAFRDFETAARAGYAAAWFRLGRDYENFNDAVHAKDCFERGAKLAVESCVYRMGMAHLLGQLGLPPNPATALPFLQRAATLASTTTPQPAYVYALLLLGEFSPASVPPSLLPQSPAAQSEARRHLERAAYLGFAPAQYKLGHAYEFASPPFPFDALLSVQYYSLASQQAEVEADMALSKWFLCGAEGAFDKDEGLAFTFAEKAARRGLPSAEFAMGYYKEVGVGGEKDIQESMKWYSLAAEHGNTDAVERIAALNQSVPQALSRQEHDTITEAKLVRKRTQARERSSVQPRMSLEDGRQVMEMARKSSIVRQVQQQSPPQVHAQLLSLSEGSSPSAMPQQLPPQQQPAQRQFANQHRYTLVDPGSGSATPVRQQSPSQQPQAQQPAYARAAGRPPGQRQGSAPQPQPPAQAQGPLGADRDRTPTPQAARAPGSKPATTFAEMGIQGAKLEEKECVIM